MVRPALVIFDMDDVLCHYDLGRRLRALANHTDATARDVRAALWDSGFEDAADSGTYPDGASYLAAFNQRLSADITLSQWIATRREAMIPFPDVLAMAAKIKQQAEIAIFTNNGPIVKSHLADLFPEAAEIFADRYCSYEFDTKKPDPLSYTRLLAKIGRAPSDAWFIDDKRSNVQGARLAGLRATHFRSAEELAAEAISLGFVL